MGFYKKYFLNKKELTSGEYKYAKTAFIISDAVAASGNSIASGSYVAAFLAFLGASEAESNFVMSLGLFAGFLLFLLPAITKNVVHKKALTVLFYAMGLFFPALMFLTPFVFGVSKLTLIISAVLLGAGFICTYFLGPLHSEWFMNCVEPGGKVASFCGIKDTFANATLMGTFFALALITKIYTGEAEKQLYLIFGIAVLFITVIRVGVMVFAKEPYVVREKDAANSGIIDSFKDIFKLKQIRPYLVFSILFNVGYNLVSSLANIVYVQRFKIPLEVLSYVLVLDLVVRTLVGPVCGKIADKFGAKKVLGFSVIALGINFLLHVFMTNENALVMRIISAVLFAVAYTMYCPAHFSFLTETLPKGNRSSYIACTSSVFYLIGYVSSLVTTWFIGTANGFKVNISGFELSEIGIIFTIGSALLVVAGFYIMRQKKKPDNK